jgi:hypothetical protein
VGLRRLKRRTARALAGLFVAWLLAASGAALAWGVGYGLLVAGAALAFYLLVIYDVDEPPAVQDPGPAVVDVHPHKPLQALPTLRDLEGDGDL